MLTLLEQHQAYIATRRLQEVATLGSIPPVPWTGDCRIQVCPQCSIIPTTMQAQHICPVCKLDHDKAKADQEAATIELTDD